MEKQSVPTANNPVTSGQVMNCVNKLCKNYIPHKPKNTNIQHATKKTKT